MTPGPIPGNFPWPVTEIRLELDGLEIDLVKVADQDSLLDALIAKGIDHEDVRDELIPYWADLWPSALGLSRYLFRNAVVRPGQNALELGCGLGLPGIVAGKLGAARVVLSDYLPEALDFASKNWMKNLPVAAQTRLIDWRNPDPADGADLVLASDITYEARFFAALPHAFRTLCRPGGRILVSDPRRAVAQSFFAELPAHGFTVECTPVEIQWENLSRIIDIYRIQPE